MKDGGLSGPCARCNSVDESGDGPGPNHFKPVSQNVPLVRRGLSKTDHFFIAFLFEVCGKMPLRLSIRVERT